MSEFNWKNSFDEQQCQIINSSQNGDDATASTIAKLVNMLDQVGKVVNEPKWSAEIGDAVVDLMEFWSKADA